MTRPDFDPDAVSALDWIEQADLRYERERGAPYATIEGARPDQRFGSWHIRIHHGAMVWGPDGGWFWRFGSRAFAERCASSLLLKYWRHEERFSTPPMEFRP